MATAFQPDAFQVDGFQVEAAPPEPPVQPGGAGGGVGTSAPSWRTFVHYAKEYPEERRTPVAEAVAEVAEEPPPAAAERREPPPAAATVFNRPPPAPTAEEILLAELLIFEQQHLLLSTQIQADLLAIQALRDAALAQEEDEAIELFLMMEA